MAGEDYIDIFAIQDFYLVFTTKFQCSFTLHEGTMSVFVPFHSFSNVLEETEHLFDYFQIIILLSDLLSTVQGSMLTKFIMHVSLSNVIKTMSM